MNFFPLCTAIVWPTISGTTVDRRDQVLMTFFSLARFIASTFSRSGVSTNGPFFSDLLITFPAGPAPRRPPGPLRGTRPTFMGRVRPSADPPTLLRPPLHDEAIGRLAVTGLEALGRLTPRRHRVAAAGRLAFTTAERVVDRVHRDAAVVR